MTGLFHDKGVEVIIMKIRKYFRPPYFTPPWILIYVCVGSSVFWFFKDDLDKAGLGFLMAVIFWLLKVLDEGDLEIEKK